MEAKEIFRRIWENKNIGNDDTDGESAEPVKKKRKKSFWGDTEYGIGWLPLGGYCKIAGMIDESMDTEQMKNRRRNGSSVQNRHGSDSL